MSVTLTIWLVVVVIVAVFFLGGGRGGGHKCSLLHFNCLKAQENSSVCCKDLHQYFQKNTFANARCWQQRYRAVP